MSIIHDALKKLQNNKKADEFPSPPSPQFETGPVSAQPDVTPTPASQPKVPTRVLIAALTLLSLTVAVIFFFLIKLAAQTNVHPTLTAVQKSTAPAETTAPAASKPANAAAAQEAIKLEGIIEMGGRKLALINGGVYEKGQTVGGHVIQEIDETGIKVSKDDQTHTIPIFR